MRATWSGMIQLGLVALPVRLYAATEEHPVRLHEIHTVDTSRVAHRRFCRAEGREIPYDEIGKGAVMPDGSLVPITEDDLALLPLPTKRTIEVIGFVPGQDIDPISHGKPYYVGPGGPEADRPYVLLTEALSRTGYVAVAKLVVRSRERLALLRPRRGVLVCQTLLWEDELRDPGDLAPTTPTTERELELAEVLIRELTGVDIGDLHDEYGHALEQLVAAKSSGRELTESPAPAQPTVDLMTALEESVRAARSRRS